MNEFKLNFHGLAAAGFILPNGRAPSRMQIIWLLAVQVPYILIHILAIVEFFTKPFNLLKFITVLFLTNNGFQTCFRPLHLMLYKRPVEDLLALINNHPESDSEEFSRAESEMRRNSRRRIFRFSLIMYIYHTLTFAAILFPAIIRSVKVGYCGEKENLNLTFCADESNAHLVYDFWWFTDPLQPPTFYFCYAFNVLMVGAYFLILCASDSFTCSVFIAVAERCKFLARTAPKALLPDKTGQITPYFTAWIKYHQNYYNLIVSANKTLGPIVFVTHVLAAFNIMAYVYTVIYSEEKSTQRECFAALIGLAIQFYLFAFSGQQIINKSIELSRATLTAGQVAGGAYKEEPTRSALLIVMARSCGERTEEITGLGYFTISMRFYARIISVSATYVLFMLQLQEENL